MTLEELVLRWGLPPQFTKELTQVLAQLYEAVTTDVKDERSEAFTKSECRLMTGKIGTVLHTNNVGVLQDITGRPVRYGLANDSAKMNAVIKSADGIGCHTHTVTLADVGRKLGVFLSVEYKRPGWKFTGTGREPAQLAWANAINRMGGVGLFATRGQDVIDRLVNERLLSTDQLLGLPK